MNALSDPQLLRAYAERRAEAAFAELVRRHIDFVHSAAVRMVNDPHLAKDVSQGVFVALAKDAGKLTNHPALSGWLHRTARNIAAQTVRTDVRRRDREKEAAVMNENPESDAPWEEIAPHLDAALAELSEPDRDAVLLRYFENKPAQEMAAILGITAEAAQKRVSRAVERLRENFAKRGITAGAAGLSGSISANAVQVAPAGLAATFSIAVLSGKSTAIATTRILAMTTLRKNLVAITLTVIAGAGIYFAVTAANPPGHADTSQERPAARKTKNPRPSQGNSPVENKNRALSGKLPVEREDIAKIPWPNALVNFPPVSAGDDARLSFGRYEITRRRPPDLVGGSGTGGHWVEIELRDTKSSWSSTSTMQSVGGRLLEDHGGRPQIENWGRGGGGNWTRQLYRNISGEYKRVRTDEFLQWIRPGIENSPTTEPPFGPRGEDDLIGRILYFVETRIPES